MYDSKRDSQSSYSNQYDDDMDGGMDLRGEGGIHDIEKDRKMFSKRKNCWFCAKKTEPDWKDPQSYSWLVSEFGKISARRITGMCAVHQRKATLSIRRGRQIGFLSHLSNQIAS